MDFFYSHRDNPRKKAMRLLSTNCSSSIRFVALIYPVFEKREQASKPSILKWWSFSSSSHGLYLGCWWVLQKSYVKGEGTPSLCWLISSQIWDMVRKTGSRYLTMACWVPNPGQDRDTHVAHLLLALTLWEWLALLSSYKWGHWDLKKTKIISLMETKCKVLGRHFHAIKIKFHTRLKNFN